jgi:S-DNA-T family DNA segregation ATPase FtsK/SpoIIIE
VFGKAGLIIITLLVFALYITYFFAGGKSIFSRLLLKAIDSVNAASKNKKEEKAEKSAKQKKLKEKKKSAALTEKQKLLYDDDFFEADNGMSELTISELGIKETRDKSESERNPTLQERVHHKSGVLNFDYENRGENNSGSVQKNVNMDYTVIDPINEILVSNKETDSEENERDFYRDEPRRYGEENAADVFNDSFEPFDIERDQTLKNKPSSKSAKATAEPEGISEFATPINILTPEDVEQARKRADFEMKKKAAIEAQRRYSEAKSYSEAYGTKTSEPEKPEEVFYNTPEESERVVEEVRPEEKFEGSYKSYEEIYPLMRDEKVEFKPYVSPAVDTFTETRAEEKEPEELKITRNVITPSVTYSEVENEEIAEEESEEELEFELESASSDFNNFSDEEVDTEAYEIPEEEQNDDVKEYRNMFNFLRDEEAVEDASSEASVSEEINESFRDNSEEEEEYVPFTPTPKEVYEAPKKEEAPKKSDRPDYSNYKFPSVELLKKGKIEEDLNQEEEKNQNAEKLVDALSQFDIRISIKGVDRGPRITRYEVVPARGVKVQSVISRFDDIALNLGAEGIRMEAPIPGKAAIGVEIPNKHPSTVLLRDLVESDEFICSDSKTICCLGKDVTGNPVFADIAKMPHVLVAGATGMGKSVCINAILLSILYKARPDEVKFIMIDPKKVEFNGYNGIPHLLVPVVTDVKQAAGTLMWAVEQMEKRYDLMEKFEVKKIDSYNDKVRENPELGEPLPKIIIVIDELNDIMLQVRKPAEDLIMSIAQKARAAGIHLIIGTQRPSVDVITGVIKANIPSRISCKVASYNDSKTILEQAGADKLLNNGDMLYKYAGDTKLRRVQGAYVSDEEVSAIMKFLKSQAKGNVYDEQALEEINRAAQKCTKGKGDDFDDEDDDENAGIGYLNDQQFLDAVDLAIKSGKISTSLIQRKISIGYGKAAKFIDIMEELGIVSGPNGQKPRDVLLTKDEWHEMLARRSMD